jgi:EAL domain-containing protein (putative c-di-GMP-specific phosphodiesterase class I)
MEEGAAALPRLRALKGLGVRLALDDFGTGYSSLSFLKQAPFDTLKVDRSLVDRVASNREDSAIVRTIAELAQTLGLTVVAEGIETPAQLHAVRRLGCRQGQGYYFARPLPGEAVRALVAAGFPTGAAGDRAPARFAA